MMTVKELEEKLDLIAEEAELVGVVCHPHPLGPCEQTFRKRYEFTLCFSINGVDTKISGEYLSNHRVKPTPNTLTQRPFASLQESP